MFQIGVWEHREGLAEQISRLAAGTALVRACSHPALLAGIKLDLLVVSPAATGWAGACSITCRTALLPGGLPALTRSLPVRNAVSYGTSPRDTLALSGRTDGSAAIAVQREFATLCGNTVERQELVLNCGDLPADLLLVQVGAALLLERI